MALAETLTRSDADALETDERLSEHRQHHRRTDSVSSCCMVSWSFGAALPRLAAGVVQVGQPTARPARKPCHVCTAVHRLLDIGSAGGPVAALARAPAWCWVPLKGYTPDNSGPTHRPARPQTDKSAKGPLELRTRARVLPARAPPVLLSVSLSALRDAGSRALLPAHAPGARGGRPAGGRDLGLGTLAKP